MPLPRGKVTATPQAAEMAVATDPDDVLVQGAARRASASACLAAGGGDNRVRPRTVRSLPMHVLCPHCRNPIELVKLSAREEITCPSCGSSFHLESGSTTG